MRWNLTISSAIALISISSVSMISGSRIEPLAWHTVDVIDRSVGALLADIGSADALSAQLHAASPFHRPGQRIHLLWFRTGAIDVVTRCLPPRRKSHENDRSGNDDHPGGASRPRYRNQGAESPHEGQGCETGAPCCARQAQVEQEGQGPESCQAGDRKSTRL